MRIKSGLAVVVGLALSLSPGNVTAEGFSKRNGEIIARVHFVGTAQIAADPNAAKLNEIWALPESVKLREQTLQKLAATPFRIIPNYIAPRTNDHAALIRPLLEDLLTSESYVEVRGTNAWREVMVAVRMDNTRAESWRNNLAVALKDWTGLPVKEIEAGGFKGWELKKHHSPNLFRFFRAGDWVVFGWGQDELRLQPAMLQEIKSHQRPVEVAKNYWLKAWMDWPAILAEHPLPAPVKLPRMELIVEGRTDYVRPEIKMQFAEPLGLKLEPWRIPTNTIYDPIDSFTAVRGIGPTLDELGGIAKLDAAPLPNQMVMWAMQQIPFESCLAMPANDASNYLARLAPELVSFINTNLSARGILARATLTANNNIGIQGLPFVGPFLRAMHEPDGDFLLGGLFIVPPHLAMVPWDMMLKPLAPTNVVYYDWELNGSRLDQWRPLSQLYFMSQSRTLPDNNAPGQKWLVAIKTKLENCGTVVTLTDPKELTLVRNGRLGLTGFELNMLALWLDAPGFPLEFKPVPDAPAGNRFSGFVPPGK